MASIIYPPDVLGALQAREAGARRGYGLSADEQFEDHLDYGLSMGETREWAQQERELRETGKAYFAEGYRLRYSPRRIRGIGFGELLTADVLTWKVIPAGYIGTAEVEQLVYVIKR